MAIDFDGTQPKIHRYTRPRAGGTHILTCVPHLPCMLILGVKSDSEEFSDCKIHKDRVPISGRWWMICIHPSVDRGAIFSFQLRATKNAEDNALILQHPDRVRVHRISGVLIDAATIQILRRCDGTFEVFSPHDAYYDNNPLFRHWL
ncbi:hypothetical protein BDN72DRAFT_465373 [Pluteus cervinus]|uniref:Uncharacterized protein n=1 Tax=Pluteus cervinus TaxID=181527 RepID=A0ACD3A6S4_9AGAR|nr:hypothetical protein BDN72DRAFT_465373 [Pluteus cervinus]